MLRHEDAVSVVLMHLVPNATDDLLVRFCITQVDLWKDQIQGGWRVLHQIFDTFPVLWLGSVPRLLCELMAKELSLYVRFNFTRCKSTSPAQMWSGHWSHAITHHLVRSRPFRGRSTRGTFSPRSGKRKVSAHLNLRGS